MENPIIELRKLTETATQTEVARMLGVSSQYLSDVLNSRRTPGKKILAALGLERVVGYQRKRAKK